MLAHASQIDLRAPLEHAAQIVVGERSSCYQDHISGLHQMLRAP
jgi:hypothetical protein